MAVDTPIGRRRLLGLHMVDTLCPYCSERATDSLDNVFPDFLGGSARIAACERCNNTFGHTIEAASAQHLQQLMYVLRLSGMPTPGKVKWKGIKLGDRPGLYNVDQDLNASPTVPVIERDNAGKIVRATGSKRHVTQVIAAIERQGRKGRIADGTSQEPIPSLSRVTFPLDDDIKRLCVKMSVGVLRRAGMPFQLGGRAQEYLLRRTMGDVCPVRLAMETYPRLDERRPLAGHLVYVRANPVERRVYSIVQLFTIIQFYCELDDTYEGGSVAVVATHDPVAHEEKFDPMPPLDYPLPERFWPRPYAEGIKLRLEQLRLELVKLYPDSAPDTLYPPE